jgi:hypothetical protein
VGRRVIIIAGTDREKRLIETASFRRLNPPARPEIRID